MNDYSFMFKDELKALQNDDSEESKLKRMNIQGRYIKSNFEANKRFSSVEGFK